MVGVDRKTENLMRTNVQNEEESNRVNLSVTIPPDVKKSLQLIARDENNTVSRITENALRHFISQHPLFSGVSD
jgi:hypothetical protein